MDNSMEDLFSDLDRSHLPLFDIDTDKNEKQEVKFSGKCLFELTVGNQLFKLHGSYNKLLHKLILVISLSENLEISSVQFTIPFNLEDENSLELNQIPIKICGLYSEDYQIKLTAQDPNTILPLFMCSKQLIQCICNKKFSIPILIWLISLPNGIIYSIWKLVEFNKIHCRPILLFSSLTNLITTWSVLHKPCLKLCTSFKSASKSQPYYHHPVDDLLIAISGNGLCLVIWYYLIKSINDQEEQCVFKVTEFQVPLPPSPIQKSYAHGSWLHLVTQTGHLMSVYFAIISEKNNSNLFDLSEHNITSWDITCQVANFPRLPLNSAPVNSLEQLEKSYPVWRDLDIRGFTRLSDGHLGCIDSKGFKTNLIELLSQSSVHHHGQLSVMNNSAGLNQIELHSNELYHYYLNCLEIKKQIRIYLLCLYLLNLLKQELPNSSAETSPLNTNIYLHYSDKWNHYDYCDKLSKPNLKMIIEIKLSSCSNSFETICIGDLLIDSNWPPSLSSQHLVKLILGIQSSNESLRNYVQKYLFIFINIRTKVPVNTNLDIKQSHPSDLVYTYTEPWFSNIYESFKSCHTNRLVTVPSNWTDILQIKNLNIQSLNRVKIEVEVSFELKSPNLSSVCLMTSQTMNYALKQLKPELLQLNNNNNNKSSFTVQIGLHCLDLINLLFLHENELSDKNQFDDMNNNNNNNDQINLFSSDSLLSFINLTSSSFYSKNKSNSLQIRLHSSLFSSILFDLFKVPYLPKSGGNSFIQYNESVTTESLVSRNQATFRCYLTDRLIEFKWNLIENEETFYRCRLISECPKTLWCVYQTLSERLNDSNKYMSKVPDQFNVKNLRLEYSILKKLHNSLKQIKSDLHYNLKEPCNLKSVLNNLLDSYSIVRNSATAKLFR